MREACDVIVIGAGVIGTAAAMHLAESGRRVLVLERGDIASGASGGNLGQISLADRCEAWHMALAQESLAFYRNVMASGCDIEYHETGGSLFLLNERQIALAGEAVKNLAGLGVEASILYGEAMTEAEPYVNRDKLKALMFVPGEGKLNPLLTTLMLARRAEEAGAVILRHTPVEGFDREGCLITGVRTPAGIFRAPVIVNAAGPMAWHIAGMAGVTVPICFHKGTAFVTEPMPPLIRGPVVGGGSLVKEGGPIVGGGTTVNDGRSRYPIHIGTGFIQTADGTVILAQATEDCEPDDRSINAEAFRLIAANCLSYYPQLRDVRVVRAWAACTTYTKDNLPVFGFSRKAANLLTAAGFKGAFTTAPAIGRLVRDAVAGHSDPVYEAMSPDRPKEGYRSSY